MKNVRRNLASAVLGIGFALVAAVPATAQQPQTKPELEAMLLMADGKRLRGFLQDTSKEGLLFALVERGSGSGYYWDKQVTAVAFDNTNDIMRDARAAYAQGDFEKAATAFGQIADGYANMAWVPGGFASEARYYQIESLRQLGKYAEIVPLLTTPAGQAIEVRLGEFYQSQHQLNKLWSQVGTAEWDAVKAAIASKEKPATGNQSMLPTPSFQKMPEREMVQLTFIRAKLNEAAGEKKKALEDYYRTFTLTYGNNPELALQSMEAALAIHKEDPNIANEKNKSALRQIQSLAYLYKNAFAAGDIKPEYVEFAVKPELPTVLVEEEEEEPAAEPAAPKPAAEDGGDMKKDGDDKGAKGKGKDKGKQEPTPEPPAAADDKKPEPAPGAAQ